MKRIFGFSFLLLGLALLLGSCAGFRQPAPERIPVYRDVATSGLLRAGAAAVAITPEESVFLGGYGIYRRSEGVHDPLYARALWIQRGAFSVALVSLDIVGLQARDVSRLREKLQGLDPRHLILASTHNHSGPDTLGLWGVPPFISGRSDDYMEILEARVLEAIAKAQAAAVAAETASVAIDVDPRGIMKNLRRPGLVDRELVVLHLRAAGSGKTIATLSELGCHPEVLGPDNQQITSDFPHWLRERVEAELGGVAIHVSGALGGLVTPDVVRQDFAEARRVGREVAAYAIDAVRKLRVYEAEPALAVFHAPLFLENRNWRYSVLRMTGLLERTFYRGGLLQTEVNLWQLGELRIASVPGEITPDLGLRIKDVAGGRPTMLIGLANDELGYLLPGAEFELSIFEYERTLSPSREAGDRILRRFEDLRLLEAQ